MIGYDEIMDALLEHVTDVARDAVELGDEKAAAMLGPLAYGVETVDLVRVGRNFASVPVPGASRRDAEAMAFVAGFQVAAKLFAAREVTS